MIRILKLKHLIVLLVLLSYQVVLNGQSKSHLPYSIFGIGELSSKGLGRNLSMGKTGIALASDHYLNNINPASYFLMDSISFFFDVGIRGEIVNYKTNARKQSGNDINLNNVTIGFRITPFWSTGIGVTPYSSVGYKIFSEKFVEGNLDKHFIELTGSGGLTQFYWDNSFRIFKNFSLGASVSYLFGNIEARETSFYSKITNQITYTETSYFKKLFVDFGMQYLVPVNDNMSITIGGIYGNQHKLDFKQEVNITDSNGNEIENELLKSETFRFPIHYGGGIAVNYRNKLTVTGDYTFHNWEETKTENVYYKYSNSGKFRFGVEYIPGADRITTFLGLIRYRAGFYHDQSYLEVENNRTSDTGFTFGLSFPFLRDRSTINIAVMSGKAGTIENGLIQQRYTRLFLSLELHDWWFRRAQYE